MAGPSLGRDAGSGMFERQAGHECFYVPARGPDDRAVRLGLGWLVEWLDQHGGEGVILTPAKRQLESSVLTSVAPEIADELRKGRKVRTPGGSLIRSETHGTIRRNRFGSGVVLALWASKDTIRDLEEYYRLDALCLVPWLPEEIDSWVAARRATDLTGSREQPAAPTITDGVVLAAMKSVTNTINMNNRLVDSFGKDAVVGAFRALKKKRYSWDPEEISVWALANGWPPEAAERLREFAAGVLAGKAYRAGPHWRPDIVKHWEEEASQTGSSQE